MFRILGDTRIDFMSKRRLWAVVSLVLVVTSLVLLVSRGLTLGVEFQGGAEVVLQFKEPQDLGAIRQALHRAGFPGAQVTTVSQTLLDDLGTGQDGVSSPGAGTGIQIKVPLPEEYEREQEQRKGGGDLAEAVIQAVRGLSTGEAVDERSDLNTLDAGDLTGIFTDGEGISPEEARRAADAILAYRRGQAGLIPGMDAMLADPEVASSVPERLARVLRQAVRVDPRADLNTIDQTDLARFFEVRGDLSAEESNRTATAILSFRDDRHGIVADLDSLISSPQLAGVITPSVRELLETQVAYGDFSLRKNDSIGPQVRSEMAWRAIQAIAFALVGMLAYIGIRFKGLQWGMGAIFALSHDVIICLGIFSLAGMETTLPVVAAFLTLVGYSVNDTIVVFDRIRENLRARRSLPLEQLLNESINQTLSRTVLTSGTTWVVVASLFFLGGSVIHGFAFVLLVGVVVGTYSSIYVASPLMLFWQNVLVARRKTRQMSRRSRPTAKRTGTA